MLTAVPQIGDTIFVHLKDGLPGSFGGRMRFGTVTDIGLDALMAETMIQLDDGGPRIYLSHIRALSNHGISH